MNGVQNDLLHKLTGKNNLHETSVEALQSIINQYPYFPLAHFLLSKKLKQESSDGFVQQVQKTAVYFPNPYWLHYQLLQKEQATFVSPLVTAALPIQEQTTLPDIDEPFADVTEEDLTAQTTEPTPQESNLITEKSNSDTYTAETIEHIVEQVEQHEQAAPHLETKEDVAVGEVNDFNVKDEDELPPLDEEETKADVGGATLEPFQKLSEVLDEQVAEFKKPVEEDEQLLVKPEPYHTVDYFASQGIKLDPQSQDNLDKKVRRFTDWLKQMKKISPTPSDLGTDEAMETAVQHIAATSNEPKEVVTEAMAEVLLKQGKTEKAKEVYAKLSFLNPDKYTYFAAKIEALK